MLSGFSKSAGKWLSCGIKVRLWRRAHFCIGRSDSFSGMASGDVCVGDHWLDVMNPWEALTMKIRPGPRKAESNGVGCWAGHPSADAQGRLFG